jgi:energy-coupling factor transport system substrate-specific component
MSEPARAGAWTLRETLVVAISGVVFGFLYLAWVQLWLLVQGLTGPLAMDVLFGFWFSVSIFAAYIVRKPGVAFVSEMITAVTQILAGNPSGAILLLTAAVQGAGAELPLALTRWRNYRMPVLLLSGAAAAVFSFAYNWVRFGYWKLAPALLVTMFLVRAASGVLLGAVVGRLLARAVRRTGVLRGLAADAAGS